MCDEAGERIIDYRIIPVACPEETSATVAIRRSASTIAPATRCTSACLRARSY
jgi:hypothetical protein